MNSPSEPDFDRNRLHELATAALEGSASESELRELTVLLRDDGLARDEYLRLVDLHAVLATQAVAEGNFTDSRLVETTKTSSVRTRRWLPMGIAAMLAGCFVIGLTWFKGSEDTPESDSFASIAQGTDVVWDSDTVAVGDRVGASTLKLRSGILRLDFDSGVEVTLEGPAEYRLVDIATTSLASGMLTATVPPGAEGFTVDTPSAQVIDLGTSFGIDIGRDGYSSVSVFDGEVEVAPRNATKKRLLTEGESIRIGSDFAVEDISFDLSPFEGMWPVASGIANSSESIQFVPPWPRQIRFVQSDHKIFVRPEGHAVRLKSELKLNISEPRGYSTDQDLTPTTLATQQFVRSYILHYAPETQLGPARAKRVTGSITFARPVLGLIVDHEELAASSRRFGRRGAGEFNQHRELNLTGDAMGDRISLSEDRRTVTLDLVSPGRSSDLVRIIVDGRRKPRRAKTRGSAL